MAEAAEKKADEEEAKGGADKKDDKKDKKDKKEEKDAKKGEEGGKEGEAKEGEGAEGEAAPKKSKKKLIIIGAVALVVLLAGAAGAYFVFFSKHEETAETKAGEKAAAKAVYYTLPEFLVNLNSGGKQTSFLKMTVVLELESQLDVLPLEGALPKMMDAFNTYLRELRSSDLSGSAGIQRLREELLLRANQTVDPVKVRDVLFKEIIVQ